MNGSEKLDQVAPALVAAQGKIRNPRTDSKAKVPTKSGGQYEYKYLSLPALLEYVRDAFRELGLALAQEVTHAEEGVYVTTRILHLSGQWLDFGPLFMPARGGVTANGEVLRAGPQEVGSAITYGRRYSLAAAVGLSPEEDDDGARAQAKRATSSPPPSESVAPQASGPVAEPLSTPGPAPASSTPACAGAFHLGPLTPAPNPAAAAKGLVGCEACGTFGKWELIGGQGALG